MKIQIKRCLYFLLCGVLLITGNILYAQPTYQPLAVTGFTQDIVAESGSGALNVTTCAIDGSNHCLYTQNFATLNNFAPQFPWDPPAGGLPDNGTLSNSATNSSGNTVNYNTQLADYTANNALIISDLTGTIPSAVVSGTLTLQTPVAKTWFSIAAFSTEGNSIITATFNFTDGTSATSPNQQINDWCGNPIPWWQNVTPPIQAIALDVINSSMGWTDWVSPTVPATGYDGNKTNSNETEIEAVNVMVPCGSQGKTVQSITFNYIVGDGGAHRVVIMGLSGYGNYSAPNFSTDVLPARCGNDNGIASVTSKGGGTSPFTYSWNTTPAQTTNIITGLTPGSYICTVADSNGCTFPFTGTVILAPQATLTASASPATVCAGTSTTLTVASSTSTPIVYNWTPGAQFGSSVTVSPAANTTYTVIGKDFYGCADTTTIAVTVALPPTASFSVNPDPSCSNVPDTVTFTGSADASATYDWNNFSGATVVSGSGAGPYKIQFTQPGSYDLKLSVTDNGCSSDVFSKPVSVLGAVTAPVITVQSVTANSVTFSWQPVPGATGYQVSVNDGPYTDPSSGGTGTSHTVSGLTPLTTVKLNVIALSAGSCQSSPMGTNTGKTMSDAVFIPNSFTPNGDGKNDVFKIYSNQATGMDMRIFDQWGELLYSTTNLNGGWDGTYKGKVQPSGVYIYAIRVTLTDGTQTVRKGSINLVR